MLSSKICISLADRFFDGLLRQVETVQELHSLIEIRIDYLSQIDTDILSRLRQAFSGKIILTCRSIRDGGEFVGSDNQQIEILNLANKLKFDYVDIDLRLIDYLNFASKSTSIIVSYHNFNHTPNYLFLKNILQKMKNSQADIYKFACLVRSEAEAQILYKLLINRQREDKMIVLGMGAEGKTTRIINPLLGSYLTFASFKKTTAPGQLSFDEMRDIYNLCNL